MALQTKWNIKKMHIIYVPVSTFASSISLSLDITMIKKRFSQIFEVNGFLVDNQACVYELQ